MSDSATQVILTVCNVITALGVPFVAYLLARLNTKTDAALRVSHATHILVNNAMSVQLRENAELKRGEARRTGEAIDLRVAEAAETLYADHMAKQAVVDRDAQKHP